METTKEKTRTCTICKKEKPLIAFVKHNRGKAGYTNICKDCKRDLSKAEYQRNKSRYKARYREHKEEKGITELSVPCSLCNSRDSGKRFTFSRSNKGKRETLKLCYKCYAKFFINPVDTFYNT